MRSERSSRSKLSPTSPAIHIHLDSNTLKSTPKGNSSPNTEYRKSSTHSKQKRFHPSDDDSDDSASDIEPITIRNVLENLHKVMPASNFLQYLDALESHGIHYARSVLDFDRDYFVKTIKMADGAVGEFTRSVERTVRKQAREIKKQKKRARVCEKENEAV